MKFFSRNKWCPFSASVAGPKHLRDGKPNQDYVLIRRIKNVVVATVSDGLGSHEFSDLGSKNACLAVVSAAEQWLSYSRRDPLDLLRLIQTIWLMKLRPVSPNKAGATCLFVIAEPSGLVSAGKLGDGLILIDDNNGELKVLEDKENNFFNHTVSLTDGGILNQWEWHSQYLKNPGGCICLMTDGISEDLEHEKLNLLPVIIRQLSKKSRRSSQIYLEKELNKWETLGHQDDKSIAALLRR